MHPWAPGYRTGAWTDALRDQNVVASELAHELAARYAAERRARHAVFPDAAPALEALGPRGPLVLVTNGAACLHREKLAASGLERFFAAA